MTRKKTKTGASGLISQALVPYKKQTVVRSRNGRRSRRNPDRLGDKLVTRICGLSDPFCSHARGAKYPDDSSVRTVPFTFEGITTVLTSAAGTQAVFLWPQFTYLPIGFGSTASLPTESAWDARTNAAPLTSVSQYRIVSVGFTLKRISAPLYSSGMVHIRSWPSEAYSPYGSMDIASYSATYSQDIPLQDCSEVAITLEHSSQMPQVFYDVSSDSSTVSGGSSRGFNPVTLYLVGCPASSDVLQIHWVIHYELIFDTATAMAQIATPPPPANPVLTAAANSVTSVIKPVAEHGAAVFGEMVVRAAKTAISRVLLGPTASAVAMIVD